MGISMKNLNVNKITLKIFIVLLSTFAILYIIGIPLSKSSPDTETYPFFVALFPIYSLFLVSLLTLISYIILKIITKYQK